MNHPSEQNSIKLSINALIIYFCLSQIHSLIPATIQPQTPPSRLLHRHDPLPTSLKFAQHRLTSTPFSRTPNNPQPLTMSICQLLGYPVCLATCLRFPCFTPLSVNILRVSRHHFQAPQPGLLRHMPVLDRAAPCCVGVNHGSDRMVLCNRGIA